MRLRKDTATLGDQQNCWSSGQQKLGTVMIKKTWLFRVIYHFCPPTTHEGFKGFGHLQTHAIYNKNL